MKEAFIAAAFFLAASGVALADGATGAGPTGGAGGMIYGSYPSLAPPRAPDAAGGLTPTGWQPPVRAGGYGGHGNSSGYGGDAGGRHPTGQPPSQIPNSLPWTQPVY